MNQALQDMLAAYRPQTPLDYLNAVREVVQEIALVGFWRGGFFEQVAFYGGTALRIFYGLDRYSEDLDFTLLSSDSKVRIEPLLPALRTELQAWGFDFEAETKAASERTGIESAFLKGSTQFNLLQIGAPEALAAKLPRGQKIRIKLELDTAPPQNATSEILTKLLPTPHHVRVYDLPSLFAGKLHALLCRSWKNRVKGRDFYDFVWYVARGVKVNLSHLEARMRQSGHWEGDILDQKKLHLLLVDRFQSVDVKKAVDEVQPFLKDSRATQLWTADFFADLAERVSADI